MSRIEAHSLPEGVGEPVDMVKGFSVNTPEETLLTNINSSIRRQLQQFYPQADQPGEIAIVAGGWSLDEKEILKTCWEASAPIIALNGAGKWLMERNIRPAVLMVLDANPKNADFIIDIPGCKYMIASQCAPEVFDACEDKDTYIYHAVSAEEESVFKDALDGFYQRHWINVTGGSTVGLRSITLARMMGFRPMHMFGFDSCMSPEGEIHPYPQDWNTEKSARMYWAMTGENGSEGREFQCATWQASQAQQFRDFVAKNGNMFRLNIHGDGLLSYILRTGAKLKG